MVGRSRTGKTQSKPTLQVPDAYFSISEWFYRKLFITTTLLHPEIDVRKCIKSKPRAAANPDPMGRSPAY